MSALSTPQRTGRPFLKLHYDFLEEVMPVLSGNEFKVALVVYRETVGWTREQAPISFTDLERKTGMCRRTLEKVIKSLLSKGIIRLCSAIGRWGTHMYALARRYITGEDDSETMVETTIVQRPIPGPMAKNATVVWQKMPQMYGKEDHTSMEEIAIEPSCETTPQEARDVPKEIFKESSKDTFKERNAVKEEKEEEKEKGASLPPTPAPEWDIVLSSIESQVSRATFLGWFQGSRAQKVGDQFIVLVETSFHKRYLNRYADLIHSFLDPLLPASMEMFVETVEERRAAASNQSEIRSA